MDFLLWFSGLKTRVFFFSFLLLIFSLVIFSYEISSKGIYVEDEQYLLKTQEICPHITGYAGHLSLDIEINKDMKILKLPIMSRLHLI